MPANEIHLNDIGTIFEVTLKDESASPQIVDVSTAVTKEIFLKPPNSAVLVKTASFTTDGTDGKIEYSSLAGDLSEVGLWKIQGHVILGSASPINAQWRSDIGEFEVFDNLSG